MSALGGIAVVAGASGAIGSVLVERLIAQGVTVIGVVRDPDRVHRGWRPTPRFELCVADVTSPQLGEVVAAAVAGRPVGLVVNLAKVAERGRVSAVSPQRLALGVDVKAGGLLRLVRGCEADLARGARVIGFGGRLGFDPDPGSPVTSVANAALANLVRQLAREFGPRGVTAHVVAPGAVDGPHRAQPAAGGGTRREELAARSPIGRLPSPVEIVDATLALLGAAGDLLNGGSLVLDGGQRTSIP